VDKEQWTHWLARLTDRLGPGWGFRHSTDSDKPPPRYIIYQKKRFGFFFWECEVAWVCDTQFDGHEEIGTTEEWVAKLIYSVDPTVRIFCA
jgi:hypothetical protein